MKATLLGLLSLMLLACSPAPDTAPEPAAEPLMQPILLEDWQLKLGDYPPNILVVDYWASWCAPCLERFPRMVEMAAQYAEQGVTFVSFNLDDPSDPIAQLQAEEFLQTMVAPFEHLRIHTSVFAAMAWLGVQSIPAVSFYDRSGVEAVRLEGIGAEGEVFGNADVEAAIQQLLATQTPPP